MFAVVNSVGLLGLNAFAVKVEIEASKGLPSFDIVGLADASVKESRERVRSALRSSEITLPLRKIIINLAPAAATSNAFFAADCPFTSAKSRLPK